MAKREELRLDVKVTGEDDVKDLSEDIEDLFSKVDRLTSRPAELLLTSKFGQIEGEIADLVLKLETLDKMDPEVDVTIARLGQLQGDLDAVVGKIKEVDAAKAEVQITADTSQVERGVGRAKGAIDQIPRSAGGANSALANMIGNASQDLGAFTGIAGSAGVAIGQMAEYAADAKLSGEGLGSVLRSMGGVVGPIAALSVATLGVSLAMKALGGGQKEVAENTREATEAFEESIGTLDAWKSAIEDAFSAGTASDAEAFSQQIAGALEKALSPEQFDDLRVAMSNLGLTFQDIGGLVEDGTQSLGAYTEAQLKAAGATEPQIAQFKELVATWGDADGAIQALKAEMDLSDIDNTALIQFIEDNKGLIDSLGEVGDSFDSLNIDDAARKFLQLERSVDPATRAMVNQALATTRNADGTINYVNALRDYISQRQAATRADEAAAAQMERQRGVLDDIAAAYDAAGVNLAEFERRQTAVGEESESTAKSFDDINKAFAEHSRVAGLVDAAWNTLIPDMKDGHLATEEARDVWNLLQTELKLSDEAMDELVDQKVAEALEADAQAAREFAAAIADATEAIGQIDADDVANIGSALQSAFDLGDVTIDFQTTKENLRDGFAELATFLEENPVDIDWAKVLDTSQDTGLSPELLGMIAGIRDQFQEGITSAFEIAGPAAAQHFANTFLPQLRLMGMTQKQAMEFLGLPENGNVDVILRPLYDAEARADAIANLNSLAGVDPNNPIIAYVTASLQTRSMDGVTGEIISLLLAQEYGIPVEPQLAEFTPAEIADAQAQLASVGEEPVVVDMTVDDGGTVDDFTAAADEAAEERNPQFVVPKSDSLGQMETLLNAVARNRIVQFIAKSDNAGKIDAILNHVARFREQHTLATVDARNAFHTLDLLDDTRTVHINVQTHGVAAAQGAVGSIPGVNTAAAAAPTATTVAAPTATATATYSSGGGGAVTMLAAPAAVTNHVTIQAGVIGNRFEVQRAVSRALRQSQRLNGTRN